MGSCLSKKNAKTCSSPLALENTNQESKPPNTLVVEKKEVEGHIVRREIFVIKHRISHEGSKDENDNFKKANQSAKISNSNGESAPLRRTPSCTKEEVDAILIQCGRLSRSSSRKNGFGESSDNTNFNPNTNRKYSISKKSWDFDNENRSDSGNRRVSRSPVRRSESPITGNLASADAIRRIQVKRNVGVASPRARSQSPAKVNSKVSNENMNFRQQPLYLSRNNSGKREDSRFRRNPPIEVGTPVLTQPMPFYTQKLNAENINNGKLKEKQPQEAKAMRIVSGNAAVDVVASGFDGIVPEEIKSSRSWRLSRDLDINNLRVESNPTQSYTELLLEDIQNFHQKSSSNSAFSVPPCVTKACSILEAVADFSSSTISNPSSAFSEDRRSKPSVERFNKNANASLGTNPHAKNRFEIVESPGVEKYVTFGRGNNGGYMEELGSSESNSFVGYQRHSSSPSLREPNSADSTDSWAPSKSYSRLYMNPLAFQKCTVSDHVTDMDEGK